MSLKNLNINKQTAQKLFKSLLGLTYVFCISFIGCKSNSTPTTVHPRQKQAAQLQSVYSKSDAAKQIEQLNRPNTSTAKNGEPTDLPASTKPKAIKSNALACESKAAAARTRTIPMSAKAQARSPGETFAPKDGTISTEKQPPSETSVNLPVLDKPGMADELISINFNQVDIRIMLKTIGDITGINFVVDDRIRGNVTVMSPTKIRLGEIYRPAIS
jgi:hypothetical protein